MKKYQEWFNNGGRYLFEGIVYVLGIITWVVFICFLGALIRNLPMFYDKLAEMLIGMGSFQ